MIFEAPYTLVLGPGAVCTIDFTFDVLSAPKDPSSNEFSMEAAFPACEPLPPCPGTGPPFPSFYGPISRTVVVTLTDPKCAGVPATEVGSVERDKLTGTRSRDVIVALGGNDAIRGRGGNDLICAGDGKDKVLGASGRDRILGQRGKDKLLGGAGADKILGQRGKDRLLGGGHNDRCAGGRRSDRASGCEVANSI